MVNYVGWWNSVTESRVVMVLASKKDSTTGKEVPGGNWKKKKISMTGTSTELCTKVICTGYNRRKIPEAGARS